jgi:hypothetical protein
VSLAQQPSTSTYLTMPWSSITSGKPPSSHTLTVCQTLQAYPSLSRSPTPVDSYVVSATPPFPARTPDIMRHNDAAHHQNTPFSAMLAPRLPDRLVRTMIAAHINLHVTAPTRSVCSSYASRWRGTDRSRAPFRKRRATLRKLANDHPHDSLTPAAILNTAVTTRRRRRT